MSEFRALRLVGGWCPICNGDLSLWRQMRHMMSTKALHHNCWPEAHVEPVRFRICVMPSSTFVSRRTVPE